MLNGKNLEALTKELITDYLFEVKDPEVPVLSIVDLGIVRNIEVHGNDVNVTITPTYSGCPAMKVIEDDIIDKLHEKGIENVHVDTVLSPAWTTDWITQEGKDRLREFGIAPPEGSPDKTSLFQSPKVVACPHCRGTNTVMKSYFGSTACKALYYCNDCLEPFDYFKCI